jgi:hypothetical protein
MIETLVSSVYFKELLQAGFFACVSVSFVQRQVKLYTPHWRCQHFYHFF